MARATYGPKVQVRVLTLVEALLRYANDELEDCTAWNIECRWQHHDANSYQLVVKTTLRALEQLLQATAPTAKITKSQIGEALCRLDDHLGIFEDYRVHQRGSAERHFALNLWSRETSENLARVKDLWEHMHPKNKNLSTTEVAKEAQASQFTLPKGVPFQALPLPTYFVERPIPQTTVKQYLLANQPNQTRTLVVSAIYGLGGIGKSVLASAISHDAEVQAQFPDGVLWATLGQQPDVLSFLSNWIQSLGDHSYKPITPETASAHLRTLLYDKKMLLVVDDVWDSSHAEFFRVGGSGCCVLVTTREAKIHGARKYDLDVMTPDQSLSLLQQSLYTELTADEDISALAKALGYLPLALELAASQLQDGMPWEELLEELQQEISNLEILDIQSFGFECAQERQRHLSLLASFNISLRRLQPEQLNKFAWLGILPEDVTITGKMAATLWDVSVSQARALLRFFSSRSLLQTGAKQKQQILGYRLHDLMHEVAKKLITNPAIPKTEGLSGLGITVCEAQSLFLDRYRSQLEKGLWHTVPDDGYIHTHLTWHLEESEQYAQIHQLLQEETPNGKNGWYTACTELGQTASFVAAVARAWHLAKESFDQAPMISIALQCRYALIKTSLNSLTKNISSTLPADLVEIGEWSPAQGLAHIQQISSPLEKEYGIRKLIPHLPDGLLEEALKIVNGIQDRNYRAVAIADLATRMPSLQSSALKTAKSLNESYYRTMAYGQLAVQIPSLWSKTLESLKTIRDEPDRAWQCNEIARNIPYDKLFQLLEIAQNIQNIEDKAVALGAISERMPSLQDEILGTTVNQIQSIQNIDYKILVLSELAPLYEELWPEIIATLPVIQTEWFKMCILKKIAPKVPDHLLQETISIARSLQSQSYKSLALGAFIIRQFNLWSEVYTSSQIIEDDHQQVFALSQFAHKVQNLWTLTLEVTQNIEQTYTKAVALSLLFTKFPDLFSDALKMTRDITDVYYRTLAFKILAPDFPKLWPEVLEAIESIQYSNYRIRVLHKLASDIPLLWPITLNTLKELKTSYSQAYFIYALADKLPEEYLSEIQTIARGIEDKSDQLLALSVLCSKDPKISAEVVEQYHQLNFQGFTECYSALILGGIAMQAPDTWPEVFEAIQNIQHEEERASALKQLATKIPDAFLNIALEICMTIHVDVYRANVLYKLLERIKLSEISDDNFGKMLSTLSFLPRDQLLERLPAFSQIIIDLGSEKALVETAYAIRDICKQW